MGGTFERGLRHAPSSRDDLVRAEVGRPLVVLHLDACLASPERQVVQMGDDRADSQDTVERRCLQGGRAVSEERMMTRAASDERRTCSTRSTTRPSAATDRCVRPSAAHAAETRTAKTRLCQQPATAMRAFSRGLALRSARAGRRTEAEGKIGDRCTDEESVARPDLQANRQGQLRVSTSGTRRDTHRAPVMAWPGSWTSWPRRKAATSMGACDQGSVTPGICRVAAAGQRRGVEQESTSAHGRTRGLMTLSCLEGLTRGGTGLLLRLARLDGLNSS